MAKNYTSKNSTEDSNKLNNTLDFIAIIAFVFALSMTVFVDWKLKSLESPLESTAKKIVIGQQIRFGLVSSLYDVVYKQANGPSSLASAESISSYLKDYNPIYSLGFEPKTEELAQNDISYLLKEFDKNDRLKKDKAYLELREKLARVGYGLGVAADNYNRLATEINKYISKQPYLVFAQVTGHSRRTTARDAPPPTADIVKPKLD